MKNIRFFYLIFFFNFLVVRFSVFLNRHVFVMGIYDDFEDHGFSTREKEKG